MDNLRGASPTEKVQLLENFYREQMKVNKRLETFCREQLTINKRQSGEIDNLKAKLRRWKEIFSSFSNIPEDFIQAPPAGAMPSPASNASPFHRNTESPFASGPLQSVSFSYGGSIAAPHEPRPLPVTTPTPTPTTARPTASSAPNRHAPSPAIASTSGAQAVGLQPRKRPHTDPTPSEREDIESLPEEKPPICSVCLLPQTEANNVIIFCDNSFCGVAVHQACYGVQQVPPKSWRCNPCRLNIDGRDAPCLQCEFCPIIGGAFKPLQGSDNKWAHVICAYWIPQLYFKNSKTLEPVLGSKKIPSANKNVKCSVCLSNYGVVIDCNWDKCGTKFHASCGKTKNLQMTLVKLGKDLVFTPYCEEHSNRDG